MARGNPIVLDGMRSPMEAALPPSLQARLDSPGRDPGRESVENEYKVRLAQEQQEQVDRQHREAVGGVTKLSRDPHVRRFLSPGCSARRILIKPSWKQVVGDTIIDHPGISVMFENGVLEIDPTSENGEARIAGIEKFMRTSPGQVLDADEQAALEYSIRKQAMQEFVKDNVARDPELAAALRVSLGTTDFGGLKPGAGPGPGSDGDAAGK